MIRYKQICIMLDKELEDKVRNEAIKEDRSF